MGPDGKTQITIEYVQKADGSVEPKKIHTIVISTQHAEPSKQKRSTEQAGKDMRGKYTGKEMIAPSMVDMNEAIHEHVVLATLNSITLKNGDLSAQAITNIVKINFDARPGALARDLQLRQPKYNVTAAYCHFGRTPYTEDGKTFFSWEDAKDLSSYAKMSAADVEKATTTAKADILSKWVD